MMNIIIHKNYCEGVSQHAENLIPDTQLAFVLSHSILDNVIVAFEMLHSMKIKVKGKVREVALKIDISKAYDRVSREFLRHVMSKMGFASEWIELIMMCVLIVTYTVFIKG